MALDESNENDMVFEDRGISFAIEKGLFEQVKPVTVEFVKTYRGGGFQLKSSLPVSGGCGSGCSC